ncbi:MAG: 50S ribosomal protein L10 [Patescibacteria group bacterium]
MPKNKTQKKKILSDLGSKISQAKTAVFVNFSGIPVKEINTLRTDGKKQGVSYTVTKKTLFKKALAEAGFKDVSNDSFKGEIAAIVSISDDIVPAKLVHNFAKTQEKMKILGGIFSGKMVGAPEIVALAQLPSKDELLAKMVGSLASPLSGFVRVLQGNLRGLVYALNSIKEKKSV